jgi:hypothetical protein
LGIQVRVRVALAALPLAYSAALAPSMEDFLVVLGDAAEEEAMDEEEEMAALALGIVYARAEHSRRLRVDQRHSGGTTDTAGLSPVC